MSLFAFRRHRHHHDNNHHSHRHHHGQLLPQVVVIYIIIVFDCVSLVVVLIQGRGLAHGAVGARTRVGARLVVIARGYGISVVAFLCPHVFEKVRLVHFVW